jgi:HEAT repeat protein
MLAAADWRGQEQAALLLAQFGHRPAAGRLVGLLPSGRGEVAVAAAWGLRRLAVSDTLPAALEFFRTPRQVGPAGGVGPPAAAVDQQLSQLAQFFGEGRYRPADAALRLLVPRGGSGPEGGLARLAGGEARAAAIWALGLLHKGRPVPELVSALEGRLSDVNTPAGNEDHRVRWMSAVALGRMKSGEALPVLRRFSLGMPSTDPVSNACLWAASRITGEAIPPAGTAEVVAGDWPLSPLGP